MLVHIKHEQYSHTLIVNNFLTLTQQCHEMAINLQSTISMNEI